MVLPVVTPAEVKAGDEIALTLEPLDTILARVGSALAAEVVQILGGTYGRRINALIGPGLNGADTEVTVQILERQGVRVRRFFLGELPPVLPPADLTLDGLLGIGIDRPFEAPDAGDTPVAAIDIVSGIDGLTGEAIGRPLRAGVTLTLMAYKPGLLFGAGAEYSGEIRVLDIGLDPQESQTDIVTDADVGAWLPKRSREAHKWNSAVLVVAGSPGMTGASHLVCRGALRTGAGYVHLDSAAADDPNVPTEVVVSLAGKGPRADVDKFGSLVIGPGLGRGEAPAEFVRTVLGSTALPTVIDGDGLSATSGHLDQIATSEAATVLTPHDGEYERLMGHRPGHNRIDAARELAAAANAIVLLKGPTTVVAAPDGQTLLTTSGDARLATAGTGDVLAGMIGALLAQGVPPLQAAAAAAHLHGRAAQMGPAVGLIASDLPELIPAAVHEVSLVE